MMTLNRLKKKETVCEKSVGTTELHYSTKKRYHVLDILVCLKLFVYYLKSGNGKAATCRNSLTCNSYCNSKSN